MDLLLEISLCKVISLSGCMETVIDVPSNLSVYAIGCIFLTLLSEFALIYITF